MEGNVDEDPDQGHPGVIFIGPRFVPLLSHQSLQSKLRCLEGGRGGA